MKEELQFIKQAAKKLRYVVLYPIIPERTIELERENEKLRSQLHSLKEWIQSAHRLDRKPIADTIKAALAHEKSA